MRVLNPGGPATTAASAAVATTAGRVAFDEFVVARSGALPRTAYLLTRDPHLAEDLVRTALTKAWFVRRRINGDPEPYVRRIMVNEFASGRRRRWRGERPTA
ncbi:MAG TPA: sigma factor [Actinophytocola sp.]|nr:sigma factor [Actinophytocola sp.]